MTRSGFVIACFLTALIVAGNISPVAAEDFAGQLRTPIDQSIDTRIHTQKNLDQWQQERARLVAKYESLQQDATDLTARLNDLRKSISDQQALNLSLGTRIAEAEKMAEAIDPFLETVYPRLVRLIETGLPFLPVARKERLNHLKDALNDPEASLSEKFRKTMEALFVEAAYGNTSEVYQERIRLEDDERLFSVLRVGRIALFCLSPDGEVAGYYNVAESKWRMLPGRWRRELRAAIDMAEKHRPADLVCLPLGRLSGE